LCEGFITTRDLIIVCYLSSNPDSEIPSFDACPGDSFAQYGFCKKLPKPRGMYIWIEPSAACNSNTTIARTPAASSAR